MTHEDLPCQDLVELLTDFFEGALETETHAAVERHLVWCEWCATYTDQLRRTVEVTGTLRGSDVPAPMLDVLVDAFRRLRGG